MYRAGDIGNVYLWGTALNMRKGHERYRPTFLACMLANKVIGGDMVETVHSKNEPTFDATGYFAYRGDVETIKAIPAIRSYGFAEGGRRGLVLISLDVSAARQVEIAFAGRPIQNKASLWRMSADTITANNEFEAGKPQVVVTQETLNDFGSGNKIVLPPHSMTVLEWEVQ